MSRSIHTPLFAMLLAAVASLPVTPAMAEPTRIEFGGHVSSVNAAVYPGVAVGAPVSGHVVYESVASGLVLLSGPTYGFSFDFAGTVVSNTPMIQLVANDNCSGLMADCVRFGETGKTLSFIDTSKTLLANDAMPSAAVLRNFPIIVLADNTGGGSNFFATVDRLSINPVPEPGTYALLLAGLGVVSWTLRRRSART